MSLALSTLALVSLFLTMLVSECSMLWVSLVGMNAAGPFFTFKLVLLSLWMGV